MSALFGVDKIGLSLPASAVAFDGGFSAELDNPCDTATGEAKYSGLLYRTTDGREVHGQRVRLNTPDYQLTVKADRRYQCDALALLQFSAKAYREHNAVPLGRDDLGDTFSMLCRDLEARGVKADWAGAAMFRVDAAHDPQLSEPLSHYVPIYDAIGARLRVLKVNWGVTGFTLGNSQWGFNTYDKGAELRNQGCDAGIVAPNTARGEGQFRCGATVRNFLGVRTVPELLANWGNIAPAYVRLLERDVFRPGQDVEGLRLSKARGDWEAIAGQVKASGKRQKRQMLYQLYACEAMLQQMGFNAAVRFLCDVSDVDRATDSGKRQERRITEELKAIQFRMKMREYSPSGTSIAKLYEEFRHKLLNVEPLRLVA